MWWWEHVPASEGGLSALTLDELLLPGHVETEGRTTIHRGTLGAAPAPLARPAPPAASRLLAQVEGGNALQVGRSIHEGNANNVNADNYAAAAEAARATSLDPSEATFSSPGALGVARSIAQGVFGFTSRIIAAPLGPIGAQVFGLTLRTTLGTPATPVPTQVDPGLAVDPLSQPGLTDPAAQTGTLDQTPDIALPGPSSGLPEDVAAQSGAGLVALPGGSTADAGGMVTSGPPGTNLAAARTALGAAAAANAAGDYNGAIRAAEAADQAAGGSLGLGGGSSFGGSDSSAGGTGDAGGGSAGDGGGGGGGDGGGDGGGA